MIFNWLLTYVIASLSLPLGFLIARKTRTEWEGSAVPKLVSDTLVLVAAGLALYAAVSSEPLSVCAVPLGMIFGYFAAVGFEFLPAASLVYYLDAAIGGCMPVVISCFWLSKGPSLELRTMLFQWPLFLLVSAVFLTSGFFIFASAMPFIISFFLGLPLGQMVRR